ncbi:MAG: endopeptidase La [Thermodesulfobacteriota bacterium]|nr:MAG: endopeptidase La [Thermodesulfobacteriota bacterium]
MIFKNQKDQLVPFDREKEKTYPLLPLRDIVLFPYMVVPLFVGRAKSIKALEEALNKEKLVFLATQIKAKDDNPSEDDIHSVGTLGTVLQLLRLPDGGVKVLVEGKKRGVIQEFLPHPDFFQVYVREIEDATEITPEVEALMRRAHSTFENYVKLSKKVPPEMLVSVSTIDEPNRLTDTIAAHLTLKLEDKQKLLEIENGKERLEKLYSFMEGEIEILEIEKKIRNRVKKQMEKTQKEYYLSEQMRAIQKEMGDRDDMTTELKDLEEQIKKKKMSPEATDKVKKEFKKLKMMPPMSAEVTVVRNYIDWMLSLPWFEKTETKLNIDEATQILEEDHYGLKDPKERILEYLAVQGLVEKLKGPILCFVGPPGVGKTSLAKSIARATGRNFVRLSLGGVRDEAEIRGHRRTYIGALPGKILQGLKKAGSNNPVFLLDEVDKMSADFRGDPSAALLEVLDPEQNHAFNDHYVDVDYDLSEVMFITTANLVDPIIPALRDRMEIIRLPGYTEDEKLHIARLFLIPKQIKENGLTEKNITFTDNSILTIIRRFTREAGVRNLEREIASICRKVAKEVIRKGRESHFQITAQNISKYLGVYKFRYGKTEEKDEIGMTTGLAWTEAGGELLSIEAIVMPGKGNPPRLTGKLGDVMQESAHAAWTYIRSRGEHLGLDKDFFQNIDIHIHVPEGATPKDGPSAGVAMATSLASAVTKKPVRKDIAMTGEITLRGKVLPIGGLKEKLIAAHRGNVTCVIIPRDNEKDLKEIPPRVKKDLKIILTDHVDEVLRRALILDDPEKFLRDRFERTEEFFKTSAEKGGELVTH